MYNKGIPGGDQAIRGRLEEYHIKALLYIRMISGMLASNGITGFYDPSGVVNFSVHVCHPDLSN